MKRNIFKLLIALSLLFSQNAFAKSIKDSNIVEGIEKLIGDLTTWLMVLAPVVSGMLIIYFCIRCSAADENEHRKWHSRIKVAIISCVGAIIGSATLNILIGYFK